VTHIQFEHLNTLQVAQWPTVCALLHWLELHMCFPDTALSQSTQSLSFTAAVHAPTHIILCRTVNCSAVHRTIRPLKHVCQPAQAGVQLAKTNELLHKLQATGCACAMPINQLLNNTNKAQSLSACEEYSTCRDNTCTKTRYGSQPQSVSTAYAYSIGI
jgi:hypothetical protein